MRLFNSRHAESLIESIVAITVIVLSTTAAMSLIRTSVSGNKVIAEKVIAMNLALEGVEAVKNIRDTNYLNFSSKPEDCWDAVDAKDISECDTAYGAPTATLMRDLTALGKTYYLKRILQDEAYRFSYELSLDGASYEDISLYDVYDSSGSNKVMQLYAQSGLESLNNTVYRVVAEDIYKRSIVFTENTYDPLNAVDVSVSVEWESKGANYSVTMTRTIANVY